MDPITLIGIGLQIVSGVLGELKKSPTAVLTAEQMAEAEAGLELLAKVHGTAVTKAQMDALRG